MSMSGAKLSLRRLPVRWQSALRSSVSASPPTLSQCTSRRYLSSTPQPRQDPKPKHPEAFASHAPNPAAKPSTNSPSAQDTASDNTIPISIPGPSWLWVPLKPLSYPINAYSRAQTRRPYLTQFISSLIIYFLGDLSSQLIQQPAPPVDPKPDDLPFHRHDSAQQPHSQDPPSSSTTSSSIPTSLRHAWENYEPLRSLRAITIGGLFSIPSYHWFLFLSSLFPTRTHLTRLTLQVLISQAVFAPLFNTYFFTLHSLLSLETPQPQRAWERIRATVPTSWYNSCKFWPVVTAFNFSFVKPRSRSVVAGCVAVVWQTYLGVVNQRAVRDERERKGEVVDERQGAGAAG